MGTYSTSDFKRGIKVLIEGDPYLMVEMEFMKPGKGQAVYRTKLRNLLTGRILDRNYRSGDTVESTEVTERSLQYLYKDAAAYHFMDTDSYEQYEISAEALADTTKWLKEEMTCDVTFWEGRAISVTPPAHVELEVTYTEPGEKGNSSGNVQKPATVEGGAEVAVPTFINLGDIIKIDTRTGEYVERVTKS